ncbi:PAN domain protein [Ancylostoma duodenale]|uniref:PAN domain protein n=1 Tax=Ancylostoma duodenale TaxID=51022 RepID=A0A0C2FGE8_9BILA|nr:PAN domain protein [Ancylostoma duodenale]
MSSSRCSFMRVNSAGLTDFYDEMIPDVSDAEDCERKCIAREKVGDPCRSYTYDKLGKLCYINHQDSRSSGRSPLATRNSDLVHGTLDDCIDCERILHVAFSVQQVIL